MHHRFAGLGTIALLTIAAAALAQSSTSPFQATAQQQIVPAGAKLELVWNEGDFTEGPTLAGDGAILFSDIGNRIMRFDPRTRQTTVFRDPSGRANGLMFDQKGRLVACEGANTGGGRRISITETDGTVRTLADRYQGKRFNSPNDLAIDAKGRVYFTDPRYVGDDPRDLDFEGVFLIDTDGTVTLATRDLQKPNGILVSPDGKSVYLADNNSDPQGNHQLLAFAVQADGSLASKRVLFDFGPRRRGIDGMTLDREGNIYATAGAGDEAGLYVFSPAGKPLAFIATPGDPTNCVFGGEGSGEGERPELRQTLYITAAGPKPSEAGAKRKYGLYRIKLATTGYHIFPAGR
jgi:gluconolactonase